MDSFEMAWKCDAHGPTAVCNCGKAYVDGHNAGYTWGEGEFEKLVANGAITLDHSVGTFQLEGREYVDGCSCWEAKAERIMDWLDANAVRVAYYLNMERDRKMREATRVPLVEG